MTKNQVTCIFSDTILPSDRLKIEENIEKYLGDHSEWIVACQYQEGISKAEPLSGDFVFSTINPQDNPSLNLESAAGISIISLIGRAYREAYPEWCS